MGNRKKIGILFAIFLVAAPELPAQWPTNALFSNGHQKLMFSVSAQYEELDWPKRRLQTFDRIAGVQLGVALFSWLKVTGSAGYSQMDYRKTGEMEFRFKPDYHWGAGLFVGPVFLFRRTVALNWFVNGQWFNPYGEALKESIGADDSYSTRHEYILENLRGSSALNLLIRWKRIDFYGGPMYSREYWRIRSRELLEGDNFAYSINTRMEEFLSRPLYGTCVGIGFRFPGRYYLNLEFSRNPIRNAMILISFTQFGAPD